jgi:branched-chain amino acid transport system substrate-binding protein
MIKKLLLILILFLLSCAPEIGNAKDVIRFGWIGPLSGPVSSTALSAMKAAKLAAQDINREGGINGQKLEIIFMDTAFELPRVVGTTEYLIYSQKVDAVIGDLTSAGTLASMEIAIREKVPLLTYGATSLEYEQIENPFVLRITGSESNLIRAITEYAVKALDFERFAILYPDNPVGKKRFTVFEDYLRNIGKGTLVFADEYASSSTDFMPYLHKIKAAKPDAIMLAGFAIDSALITKQLKRIGIKAQIIGSGLAQSEKMFWDIARESANGIWVPTFYDPKIFTYKEALEFQKKWTKVTNKEPNYFAANAYDTVILLAETIRKVGIDGEKIVKEIRSPREYKGASGIMKFIQTGEIKKSIVIEVWENGELIPKKIHF